MYNTHNTHQTPQLLTQGPSLILYHCLHAHNTHHTNFHVRALTDIFGSPGRPPAALGAYFHTSHIPNTQLTHTTRH